MEGPSVNAVLNQPIGEVFALEHLILNLLTCLFIYSYISIELKKRLTGN